MKKPVLEHLIHGRDYPRTLNENIGSVLEGSDCKSSNFEPKFQTNSMNRLLSLMGMTAVCLAVVTSCDKNDPTVITLEGNWKFTTIAASGCSNSDDDFVDTCSGTAADCGQLTLTSSTYTFTPSTGSSDPVEIGTYTTSGTTLTITPTGGSGTQVFTYAVSGTSLTLVSNNPISGCTDTTVLTRI